MAGSARRGRRPGSPETRAAILAAARDRFAAGGYAGTSVRAVAAAAGVDPALVHHYFGTKDDLFLAALALRVDPREALAPVAAGGLDGAGERLMEVFVTVWDDDDARPPMMALLRRITEPDGAQLFRDGLLRLVLAPVGGALGIDEPERRLIHVASQLVGLAAVRYLVRAEPLASLPGPVVVATYAPIVQRLLADPLPSLDMGKGSAHNSSHDE